MNNRSLQPSVATQDIAKANLTLCIRIRDRSCFERFLSVNWHKSVEPLLKDKAVFVAGLPVHFTEDVIHDVFSQFGPVSQVAVHGTKTSAVVLFADKHVIEKLDAAICNGLVVDAVVGENAAVPGLKGMLDHHKSLRRGNSVLQQQLDQWFEQKALDEASREEGEAAAEGDGGWTLVVRQKGRKKQTGAGGITVAAASLKAATARGAKKQAPVLDSFYRFQKKEQLRNELVNLRQKFEEDRKRIAELRASRKFKPY